MVGVRSGVCSKNPAWRDATINPPRAVKIAATAVRIPGTVSHHPVDFGFSSSMISPICFQNLRLMLHQRPFDLLGGRVAQAFDLAGATNTVGGPFLRVFCEGAGVGNAGAK